MTQRPAMVPSVRPTFDTVYMDLAGALAGRSTCGRLHVGCVIASLDSRHVFAVGYNGGASGQENRCDSDTPGACGCLHAEDNAVINCTAPRSEPKVVYVTHMPCSTCAKRLVNLGSVRRVLYGYAYRSMDGLPILTAAGIRVLDRA